MKKLLLILQFAVIASLAIGQAPITGYYYATDTVVSTYPDHKKGHLYHNGEIINIRGINWFGIGINFCDADGLYMLDWNELLQMVEDLGFNAIRLVVSGEVFYNHINGTDGLANCIQFANGMNSELVGLTDYELVHALIGKCEEIGLYVLIDHHDMGPGSGLWYDANDVVNTTNDYLESLISVADSFAQYDNIIGIDLINEPYGAVWNNSNAINNWRNFSNQAGDSILAHNPNWLVTIEGVQYTGDILVEPVNQTYLGGYNQYNWGENLSSVRNWPSSLPDYKIIYSPHTYQFEHSFINESNADTLDNFLPEINDWKWGYLADDYAVMPGEFGVSYNNCPYGEKWLEHIIKYIAEKKLPGSFYWALNGNDEILSILETDWQTVRQDKLDDILVLFGTVKDTFSTDGGTMYSPRDGTTYTFGQGDLAWNTIIYHNSWWSGQANIPDLGSLGSILHEFEITSTQAAMDEFKISINYTDNELGTVDETKLSFYYYNGSNWVLLQSSLDTSLNKIETLTSQFGYYAVLEGNNATSIFVDDANEAVAGYYYASDVIVGLYPNHKKGHLYHHGELINLRGINWYDIGVQNCDAHGLNDVEYTELLQNIVEMGFNAVRLVYSGNVIRNHISGNDEPVSCIATTLGDNSIFDGMNEYELLETIVAKCEEMGLYVLLAHQDSIYNGNLWYDTSDIVNTTNEYISNLTMLADSFAQYENVIGIDIVYQPYAAVWNGSGNDNDFRSFINIAGSSILQHNSNWLIFAEGVQYTADASLSAIEQSELGGNNQFGMGENLAGIKNWPVDLPTYKIVFSPHSFNYNFSFVNQNTIDSIDSYLPAINDWRWGYLAEDYALVPGAFGIGYQEYSYSEKWMEHFVKYLAEKKIPGSFYWSLNGNDPAMGILESDFQTVKQNKLSDLQVLFGTVSDTISASGGTIYSPRDASTYTFGTGNLPDSTIVIHNSSWSGQAAIPGLDNMRSILHEFEVISTNPANSEFTISVIYSNNELGAVDETRLSFYYYSGSEWEIVESTLDTSNNQIETSTDQFGFYAILETKLSTLAANACGHAAGYYFATDSILDLYPDHKKGNFYHDGELLNIRGINWYDIGIHECDLAGLWAVDYVEVLQGIKDLGFNTIRLIYGGDVIRNFINGTNQPSTCIAYWIGQNNFLYGQSEYALLNHIIGRCEEMEIHVLLGHQDEIYSNNLWFDATDIENTRNEYINNLVFVAEHFGHYSNIIGIDLVSEPYGATWNGSGAANDYRDFINMAGDSVLSHCQDWMIFAQGLQYTSDSELTVIEQSGQGGNNQIGFGENLAGVSKWPLSIPNHKIVFTPQTNTYKHTFVNESTIDTIDNYLSEINDWRWGYLAEEHAVMPGGFGISYPDYSYGEEWLEGFVKYMAEKKLPGSFYWAINGDSYEGLYESDMSTLKEDKYRDLIVLYGLVDDTISSSGDTIYSPRDGTSYYFDAGDLPNNTYVKHVSMWSGKANIPELGKLKTILHEFEVISTDTANSEFTISVEYTNNELGSVDESSLSFYRHNGTYWELQTSILDTTNNIIEINTDLFGVYAVVEIDTTVGNGADTLEIVEPFAISGYYFANDSIVDLYPIHKKGNIYHAGELINLRGATWTGLGVDNCDFEGLYAVDYTIFLQNLKDKGFNALRLVYSGDVVRDRINGTEVLGECVATWAGDNSDFIDKNEYEFLQLVIEKCEELEIYVLLAHHDKIYSGNLWYDTTDVQNTKNEYISNLIFLANDLAQHENIIGIDLIADPYGSVWNGSGSDNDYRDFLNMAGDSILFHNPDWLIFAEGIQYTSDTELSAIEQSDLGGNNQYGYAENLAGVRKWPLSIPGHKIIFAPQTFQNEHSYVNEFTCDTLDNFLPAINDWRWGYLADDYAVVPGAFGVNYQQYSYNEKWMEHFVKYMAEKKLPGSFYYKLNANDGRGLLLSDWLTMKQDILIDLQLMFGMVEDTIHAAGGTIYSPRDGTSYNFGSGDLPANTIVTHTSMWSGKVNIPDLGDRGTILHEFEISSTAAANSYFSISVEYTDNELGSVDENSLSFFMFNGSGWDSIPGILDTANNQIQISTNLFGIFAVLGNNIPVSNISEIYGCTDPLSLNYNPEANINDGTCVYSPDWDYDLTAQLHTIEIPGTASFVLEDQNIEEYDFIGVFYDSLGVEKCGGYIMWEGTSITLNAYGDISGNTGFETGEKFCWKLWDASKASSFNLLANYDNSYPNTSDFANNGQSALTMIVTAIPDTQTISLNQGWNIISTNLHPCDASVENIYSSVINEICIVKDYEGNVFWPMVSINTIGNNITGRGYLVKTTSSNNFEVTGYSLMPEYNPIDLPAGWSMIAYLRNNPADLVAILSPYVSDINIVKDENGDVYWPSLGLNSVGDFDPGQGYQIYTNIPFSLTYPSNNESFAKSATSNLKPRFYNNVVHTDNNMTLGILLNNMDISIGDELAAFSNSGLLVGSTVVESENVAITLWGDDKLTDVIDGLLPGEDFIIKLKRNTNNYDNSSDEYELQIGTWYKGDGTYAINKTAIAGMASLISSDNELVLGQNYPNPFIGNTAIDFYLPEDCDVEFEIYNMLGEKLTTLYSGEISSGNHKINFNGDKLSAGTYYYQLKTANFEETKKMVIH